MSAVRPFSSDAAAGDIGSDVIVFFDGTFMRRSNGAHARAEQMLRFLSRRCGRVALYSYREHPTCPWTDEHVRSFETDFPDVSLVLDHRSKALKAAAKIKALFAALVPAVAQTALRTRLPGAAPRFAALLRDRPEARLIVNYVDGLAQLNGLDGRMIVVETHDVRFVNHRFQQKRTANCIRSLLKMRGEVALLDLVQAVVAISPAEADLFRMLLDRPQVLYVPAYPEPRAPVPAAPGDPTYDLVFVGSDNILNVDGLVGFLEAFGPWLDVRRLAVCGAVCGHPRVKSAAARCPGVALLGFVDAIDEIYGQCKAAISPVVGTGLKIKILDALDRGKPVFASPSSLAGLPPEHEGCVFPIDAGVMDRLLDDPSLLAEAGRRCRVYRDSFERRGDHDALLAAIS